jgi:hypothetical protein
VIVWDQASGQSLVESLLLALLCSLGTRTKLHNNAGRMPDTCVRYNTEPPPFVFEQSDGFCFQRRIIWHLIVASF